MNVAQEKELAFNLRILLCMSKNKHDRIALRFFVLFIVHCGKVKPSEILSNLSFRHRRPESGITELFFSPFRHLRSLQPIHTTLKESAVQREDARPFRSFVFLLLKGLDWSVKNITENNRQSKSAISISISKSFSHADSSNNNSNHSSGGATYQAMNDAVKAAVDAGVTVVVASGNDSVGRPYNYPGLS